MTLPQDLTPAVREWLHEPDRLPPPRIAEVAPLVHQTPQERGLLPRLDPGRFHMYSAVKLVVAGVIVALFGGFLLAGVLTTPQGDEVAPAAVSPSPTAKSEPDETTEPPDLQPSPMTAEELLSGMVTEEVEPGVHRVAHDGVRDLPIDGDIYVGDDGSLWAGDIRLGTEVEFPPGQGLDFVTADGTIWTANWSYDGERWTEHPLPTSEHVEWYSGKGVVLVAWPDIPLQDERERDIVVDERHWTVARLVGEEWQVLGEPIVAGNPPDLVVGDDGNVWLLGSRWHDGAWIEDESSSPQSDDPRWTDPVAPDGSRWRANDPDWDWEGEPCLDMVRSYGLREQRFLTDVCPSRIEFKVGPDGAVWALAHTGPAEDPTDDLYVITPAAMTAFEPPTASARTDLLPGVTLTVEEFDPGILRVVHDGVRDVSRGLGHEFVVGDDGSIWYVGDRAFLRLGSPTVPWPKWLRQSELWAFDVDRDGTLWIVAEGRRGNMKADGVRLRSYEDGSWTTHLRRVDSIGPWTIAPDGTVWAVYPAKKGGKAPVVARLRTDGWEPLDGSPPDKAHEIHVTRDGDVWLAGVNHLWRYAEDDGEWQEFMVDLEGLDIASWEARVLDDGTVWIAGEEVLLADGEPVLDERGRPERGDPFVMRFDGTEWERWGPAGGVPWPSLPEERLIWNGLGFDVGSIERFLSEHDIHYSVAPDGSIWAHDWDRRLYVITPEAVTATG